MQYKGEGWGGWVDTEKGMGRFGPKDPFSPFCVVCKGPISGKELKVNSQEPLLRKNQFTRPPF